MPKVKVDTGSLFERYEKKYLLDAAQYRTLAAALQPYMEQDQYGLHTICSLYYDTADFACARRCMEKPKFKQKLRLRSYGVPTAQSTVYLELKKKLDSVTYKRRVALPLDAAQMHMQGRLKAATRDRNLQEIDWFCSQQPLQPQILVCYDRVALVGRQDDQLRITTDRDVRFRATDLSPANGSSGQLLVGGGDRLMEIKTLGALPLWLCELLSDYHIYSSSFSKYETAYKTLMGGAEVLRHAG